MGASALRGRDEVLAHIARALDEAVAGRGRLVLVTGESGIGKTALAREAVRLAHQRDMDVAWGACLEGDLASPFVPWLEVLGPEGAAAVAGIGGAASGAMAPQEAEWHRLLAFHAVVDELRSRAGKGLLVILDDLQWADTPSQLLLRYVAAHVNASGVLVIGAFREAELDPGAPVATLATAGDRLALGGLDERAVAGLVADLTGEPVDASVSARLHRLTAGNPFFVIQVARLGVDRAGRLRGLTLPSQVEAVLSRRLAHLDEAAVRLLRAAAVLGEQVDADVVAEIARAGREELLGAFELAERTRILQRGDDTGRRWRFVHALFQQVCAEGLSLGERTELHRRAAAALHERGADPAAVAYHLQRAGLPRDDPQPAEAELAAGALSLDRLAWEDAAEHFVRAAAAAPPGPEHDELRVRAWLGLGDARLRAGDPEGAGAAFADAARVAKDRSWPEMLGRAALGFGAGFGGFEIRLLDQRQIDLLEEAAAVLPGHSPLRPWVLARLSVALSFVGSEHRRLALADEAVVLARQSGDRAALAAALASRCDAIAGPDHVTERLDAATEIVALAQQAGDRPLELLGRRLRLIALSELGSMADVDDEIAAFERLASRHGDPLYRWYVPLWRGMRALTRGELIDAERHADEALELGRRAGSANALVLSEMLWFVVLVERRSPALPDRFRRLAAQHPELLGPAGLPMYTWVLALVGEKAEARQRLAEIRAGGIDRIPKDAEWLPVMTQLADAAVVFEDRGLAAELRDRLEPYGQLCVVEGIGAAQRGSVARTLALLAALGGDRSAALGTLDQARPIDEGIGALLAAHLRSATARVLHQLGDPADQERAAAQARQAAAEYRTMGLDALADEAAAQAGHGFRPKPADGHPEHGSLRREGEVWALTWEGTTVRLRHSKGLADLAILLARPGVEVHVRELEADVGAVAPSQGVDPLLDRRAVAEYRARLADVEEDLAGAEDDADVERATRLRAERDFLVAELSAAFGLGGRARPAPGDIDQRLRKAVSARIREALRRLDEAHPPVANHLSHSVRTGLWCTYRPERPTVWEVDPG